MMNFRNCQRTNNGKVIQWGEEYAFIVRGMYENEHPLWRIAREHGVSATVDNYQYRIYGESVYFVDITSVRKHLLCVECNQPDLFPFAANYVDLRRYDSLTGWYSAAYHTSCLTLCAFCKDKKPNSEIAGAYSPEEEEWFPLSNLPAEIEDAMLACSICYDSTVESCHHCATVALDSEGIQVNGNFVCDGCSDRYSLCNRCQEYGDSDSSYYVESENESVCYGCYSEYYSTCCDCSEIFRNNELIVDRRGNWRCSSCHSGNNDADYRGNDTTFYESEPSNRFPFQRHVSLELEMEEGDPSDLYDRLSERWGIKEDGSLHGHGAREINSPIMTGSMVPAEIEHACRAAKQSGYESTRSCGTHLHVNTRDLTVEQLIKLARGYAVFEESFTRLVDMQDRKRWANYVVNHYTTVSPAIRTVSTNWQIPTSEYNNKFQQLSHVADFLGYGHRYAALNFSALQRHGTVEWRLFEGLLDEYQIKAMTYLLTAFVDAAKDWDYLPSRHFGGERRFSHQFSELASALMLPNWVTDWMVKRYKDNDRKVIYLGATKWMHEEEWSREVTCNPDVWTPTDHTPKCRSCRQCQ